MFDDMVRWFQINPEPPQWLINWLSFGIVSFVGVWILLRFMGFFSRRKRYGRYPSDRDFDLGAGGIVGSKHPPHLPRFGAAQAKRPLTEKEVEQHLR